MKTVEQIGITRLGDVMYLSESTLKFVLACMEMGFAQIHMRGELATAECNGSLAGLKYDSNGDLRINQAYVCNVRPSTAKKVIAGMRVVQGQYIERLENANFKVSELRERVYELEYGKNDGDTVVDA